MAIAEYVKEKPIIETERVWIRPMTKNDVPALLRWMLDQSIYTYWGKGPGKTDKNPELLFTKEAKPTKSLHMGIALK
ncbi:MAG: N-acetyltransferase, partial [Christensenellales bacterium]|nr:N-acetyltransferase [Christensenellales bacterium]